MHRTLGSFLKPLTSNRTRVQQHVCQMTIQQVDHKTPIALDLIPVTEAAEYQVATQQVQLEL